jgi:hypothetical protein
MCTTEPNKAYTFNVKITEADLQVNVAKIGAMNPYCKIIYGL